jgi:hypothetical protein
MKKIRLEVVEVLGLDEDKALLVFNHFKWNLEDLLANYFPNAEVIN